MRERIIRLLDRITDENILQEIIWYIEQKLSTRE
jgi:hypothetical protein